MDWKTILRQVDAGTARAFVSAARHVIDAMLIEGERVQQTQTPPRRDYETAALDRTAPAGGWLSDTELRGTLQKMAEAIALEKWTDGLLTAVKFFAALGAL